MLIITRKDNEQIVIDDTIVITIIEAKHGSTKVGIEAPKEMSITRRELTALTDEPSDASLPSPLTRRW